MGSCNSKPVKQTMRQQINAAIAISTCGRIFVEDYDTKIIQQIFDELGTSDYMYVVEIDSRYIIGCKVSYKLVKRTA